MKRLLLRARKDPFEVLTPAASLDRNTIADNSGNLIFSGAAYGILATSDTELTADRFVIDPGAADRINERYVAYVIPLANAFRVSYEANLIRLTQLISRLRIPVVVLGVGAQSDVRYETDRLRRIEPAVRAFVGAVLDRGPSIGVRGAFTASYLERLGFREVEVIGCPSLFLHGPDLRIEKRLAALDRDARLTLTVSPYVKAMWPIVARHVARYPNLDYVAQDRDTLERLLWGGSAPGPDIRTRMYVDPWPWIDDLRDRDFVFGTRIHGTTRLSWPGPRPMSSPTIRGPWNWPSTSPSRIDGWPTCHPTWMRPSFMPRPTSRSSTRGTRRGSRPSRTISNAMAWSTSSGPGRIRSPLVGSSKPRPFPRP